jgi:hypothetical protein
MKHRKTASVLCARDASRSKVTGHPISSAPPTSPDYGMTGIVVKQNLGTNGCLETLWLPIGTLLICCSPTGLWDTATVTTEYFNLYCFCLKNNLVVIIGHTVFIKFIYFSFLSVNPSYKHDTLWIWGECVILS